MRRLALAGALLACAAAPARAAREVPDFSRLDHEGSARRLRRHAAGRDVVLVAVLGGRCPAAPASALAALRDAARTQRRAAFLGLDPVLEGGFDAAASSAAALGLGFPVLLDEDGSAARALGATGAGEAVVLDVKGWRVRARVPLRDAPAALEAVLAGRPAPPASPGPAPCALPPRPEAPDYASAVAPILRRRCARCHNDEAGPAPMTGYAKVAGWAPMIHEVLMTRRMPPWGADPRFGEFHEDLSLPPEELRALLSWLESGTPYGEGPDPLAQERPAPASEWPLGEPDFVLAPSAPTVVPASGTFSWQYHHLMGPLEEDLWIRAMDLRPGNTRVVHHIFLYDFPAPFWEKLDDPGNWEKDGMLAIRPQGTRPLWNWTPGRQPSALPAGVAARVPKGHYLAMELHYTPSGRPEQDLTRAGLYLYKSSSPPLELRVRRENKTDLLIPAGDPEHVVPPHDAIRFEKDSYLVSLRPHMHARGTRMRATARYPGGREETLLSVPRYDFNWQHLYVYETPKRVPAGTVIRTDGAYDNSAANPSNPDPTKDAVWGMKSADEMFFFWVYYYEAPVEKKQ